MTFLGIAYVRSALFPTSIRAVIKNQTRLGNDDQESCFFTVAKPDSFINCQACWIIFEKFKKYNNPRVKGIPVSDTWIVPFALPNESWNPFWWLKCIASIKPGFDMSQKWSCIFVPVIYWICKYTSTTFKYFFTALYKIFSSIYKAIERNH